VAVSLEEGLVLYTIKEEDAGTGSNHLPRQSGPGVKIVTKEGTLRSPVL